MNALKKNNVTEFPKKSRYHPDNAAFLRPLFDAFVVSQSAPDWLRELREAAFAELEVLGLPTPKLERWKYTKLASFVSKMNLDFGKADVKFTAEGCTVSAISEILAGETPDWLRDVFSAEPAGEALGDMALWHLCNAFLRDGLVIDIPPNGKARVEITIDGHNGAFFVPRTAFRVGEGAELTVVEHHIGDGAFWNNRLTQIMVGKNATLRHYRVQDYPQTAAYTQNTHIKIDRDGSYEAFVMTTGGGLSRNQVHTEMAAENGHCLFAGANLLRGTQCGDTTILIDHQAPHCESHQYYRTVLDDQAHGVFQGKVHVAREAQKTDGYQLSNALLLSEGAEMDTKPELEIYADDVKCSHGATTGQIDEEPLFYLRSRGLSEEQARSLLIEAFLNEVIERITDDRVREEAVTKAQGWLGR